LLEDIGKEMSVPACMSALRRTLSNGFGIDDAHSVEELEEYAEKHGNIDGLMTGAEKAIKGAKIIRLGEAEARIFMNGQKMNAMGDAAENDIALVCAGGELIGAGKFHGGILSPCKVIKENR
jgi:tRNA U55 pseudouridine synthase TruB